MLIVVLLHPNADTDASADAARQRSVANDARISLTEESGCSQAAKWPPSRA